jgi:transmembrane sensor
MTILEKLLKLSDQIAVSLLENKKPNALEETDLFSESEKANILSNLTDSQKIQSRKHLLSQIDKKEDWKKIQNRIQLEDKTPVINLSFLKYAAVLLVLLGVSFYFTQVNNLFDSNQTLTPNSVPENNTANNKVTLVLGNGKTVVLGHGKKIITNGVQTNDTEISYSDLQNSEIEYNYLTIPRGEQFSLKLADGTKVWLNSESQLKFPNQFVDGKPRTVELVYGEAYFDVSPSEKHNGASFKVQSGTQLLTVLGTEFNLKAYKDENVITTTLVEGKVAINLSNGDYKLTPSDQLVFNKTNNLANLNQVNTYYSTSWKDGVFNFETMPLQEVMKIISRWYDVKVVFENEDLKTDKFSGIIRKKYNLKQIVNVFAISNLDVVYDSKSRTIYMK